MKHLINYQTHNEGKLGNWLGKQKNKILNLFKTHKFMESFLEKKFAERLDYYDLKLRQELKSSINIFHDGKLVGYIRPGDVPGTFYLRILVYNDEIVAPTSEYESYRQKEQDPTITEIVEDQSVAPPFMTKKKTSMSKLELIGAFIEWWRIWSNSGREADENP